MDKKLAIPYVSALNNCKITYKKEKYKNTKVQKYKNTLNKKGNLKK